MNNNNIFPAELTAEAINDLPAEMELVVNTYLLSIIFPDHEICLLSTLQYRFDPAAPWIVRASNISSNSREITVELGAFTPGKSLQLFWIINGITKLSSVAIFLGNKETGKFIKVAPDAPKSIEKGKDWIDEKKDIILF